MAHHAGGLVAELRCGDLSRGAAVEEREGASPAHCGAIPESDPGTTAP
jgi:hypothetical protein